MVQHALAAMKRGSFEQANALNRSRQSLPDAALAELALALADLDRASLAGELLDILSTAGQVGARRARREAADLLAGQRPAPGTGAAPRRRRWPRWPTPASARRRPSWPGPSSGSSPTARATAGSRPRPRARRVEALAAYFGQAQSAEDRYRLVVTVNDAEVYRADVAGAAEGKGDPRPAQGPQAGRPQPRPLPHRGARHVRLRRHAHRLRPRLRPRAEAATASRSPSTRRDYLAADPELDGKTLPTGFGSVVNPQPFTNKVTQVGLGGRARVEIDDEPARRTRTARPGTATSS